MQEILERQSKGEKSSILEMSKSFPVLELMIASIDDSFIESLIEKDNLCFAIQKLVISTRNIEFIKKLVKKDYLDKELHLTIAKLGNIDVTTELLERDDLDFKVQQFVVGMGKDAYPLILKLLKRKDFPCELQSEVFELGDEKLNSSLVTREDLTDEVQVLFAKTYNSDFVDALLERKTICKKAQRIIFKIGKHDFRKKLLEHDDLCRSMHEEFAKVAIGDAEFMNKLLDEEFLSPAAQQEIAKSKNVDYLFRLIERDDLDETAEAFVAYSKIESAIEHLLNHRSYLRGRTIFSIVSSYKDKYAQVLKDKFGYVK